MGEEEKLTAYATAPPRRAAKKDSLVPFSTNHSGPDVGGEECMAL